MFQSFVSFSGFFLASVLYFSFWCAIFLWLIFHRLIYSTSFRIFYWGDVAFIEGIAAGADWFGGEENEANEDRREGNKKNRQKIEEKKKKFEKKVKEKKNKESKRSDNGIILRKEREWKTESMSENKKGDTNYSQVKMM